VLDKPNAKSKLITARIENARKRWFFILVFLSVWLREFDLDVSSVG
jgi:hypothetical protein